MFRLYAGKNQLAVRHREPVTSGSVSVCRTRFEFSRDWEGLERVAVFRCGSTSVSILLDESGECVIPWEVLQKPGYRLEAGIYGTRGREIVLPTIWANFGMVLEGVDAPSEGQTPPTPELWEQELAGKADRLQYTEKGELGLYAGEKLLGAVPVSGGGETGYPLGHGLKLEEGKLTVETAGDFAGDKTLPMTAAGVQTVVGNIEALLGTI